MAIELYSFAPTIPAGTLSTAPVVLPLTMPTRIVRRIEIRIPPGPCGVMGFALAAAGQSILPVNTGQWIITDDEVFTWELAQQIESGAWQLMGYNNGDYNHTVYVRFLVDLPSGTADTATAPTVIPADQLTAPSADDLAALNSLDPALLAAVSAAAVPDTQLVSTDGAP